ncbi:Phosphoenolpyruvate carboxykinase [Dirofilaria immitis]
MPAYHNCHDYYDFASSDKMKFKSLYALNWFVGKEYKRYLEVNFSHSYSIVEDMTLLISKYDIFWMLHLAQIRDGFGYCNTFSA